MNENYFDFLNIIRKSIGQSFILSETIDWDLIWNLAKRHHLEVLVYKASEDIMSQSIIDEAKNTCMLLLGMAVLQDHSIQQIENQLAQERIPYALLKGAIIRKDYPDISTRYMSDIDFYVRPEDRTAIRLAMDKIGGVFVGTESGDEQYKINGKVGVEFHGRLLYKYSKNSMINYPAWTYVNKDGNSLTEEGYALNLIGHAVGDLLKGGPGIRYILDLWVLKNRHKPQPNWNIINDKLNEDGILDAATNLMDLSEYLFGEGKTTPLMEEMTQYVLKGGLHGDYKRGLIIESRSGKINAVFKQVFRNRTEFENRYPWLKKHKYLIPFAWVLRMVSSLKNHRKVITNWKHNIDNVTKQEIDQQKSMLNKLGL